MSRFATLAILLGALTLPGQTLPGEPLDPGWQTLQRSLPPGTRVRLDLSKGRSLEGELIEVTESGLSLAQKRKGPRSLARSEIARVYRLVPSASRRNLWLGALVGAGFGLGTGTGLVAYSRWDLETGAAPAMGAIGAAAGALVGHAVRKRFDWVEVYYRYK